MAISHHPILPTRNHQDLLRTPAALWLWGLPIGLIIIANGMYNGHRLPFTLEGILLTLATAWIGLACYVNGRGCGRIHCKIDGVLLPLLSLVELMNLVGVTSFAWTGYTNALTIIVILSFLAEYVGNKIQNSRGAGDRQGSGC
jgi:hypothetical protein